MRLTPTIGTAHGVRRAAPHQFEAAQRIAWRVAVLMEAVKVPSAVERSV